MSKLFLYIVLMLSFAAACTQGMDSQYNHQTVLIMKRVMKPNSSGIDVGAYKGELLEGLLKVAPKGQHLAFEPQPNRYQDLKKRFPGVSVYNYALGEQDGELPFVLALDAPARSGFLRREYPVGEDRTKDTVVQVRRLDDLVPESMNIEFIKIDVEGAEFMVLRGALETIKRCRPVIVFEFGQGSSENYGTTPEYVWDFFTSDLTMELFLMADWLENKPPFQREPFISNYQNRLEYMFVAVPVEFKN